MWCKMEKIYTSQNCSVHATNNIPTSCYSDDNCKLIVFQDVGKQNLTLKNNQEFKFRKIIVDGCVITDKNSPGEKKCDFLLTISNHPQCKEYYIELKGSDIKHAVEQIYSTIRKLSSVPSTQMKKGYIICNKSPMASTKIQSFQAQAKKRFNLVLIVRCSPYTDTL